MAWKKTGQRLTGEHQYYEWKNKGTRLIVQRDKTDLRYWHMFLERGTSIKSINLGNEKKALIFAKKWMKNHPNG